MKLTKLKKFPFSQGKDIAKNIGNGWCAGLTTAAGMIVDKQRNQSSQPSEIWIEYAYLALEKMLKDESILGQISTLQRQFSKVAGMADIVSKIHSEEFNGRCCKMLINFRKWKPILGHCIKIAEKDKVVNHVGLIVRSGKHLMIFEPNFGVGLFSILDDEALSLDELNNIIADIATKYDYFFYCSNVKSVIDEDSTRTRVTITQVEMGKELAQFTAEHEKKKQI